MSARRFVDLMVFDAITPASVNRLYTEAKIMTSSGCLTGNVWTITKVHILLKTT